MATNSNNIFNHSHNNNQNYNYGWVYMILIIFLFLYAFYEFCRYIQLQKYMISSHLGDCHYKRFGCCKDNITPSLDIYKSNCHGF